MSDKKHRHSELIIAWANGAEIQHMSPITKAWTDVTAPSWIEEFEYRISHNYLREAHRNGALIECQYNDSEWVFERTPTWEKDCKYRIVPPPKHIHHDLMEAHKNGAYIAYYCNPLKVWTISKNPKWITSVKYRVVEISQILNNLDELMLENP